MNRVFSYVLGVLVIAAVVILIVLRPHLETTRDREQRGDLLFNFELSQVTALKIRTGKNVLELTKDGDAWQMGPKVNDRASAQTIYNLLGLLKNLRVLDVIPGSEFHDNLKSGEFGLSKPKQSIEIQIGKQREKLLIGKDGAGEQQVFVRAGNSEDTYLIEDTFRSALARPIETFRDPRLTDLTPEQVERIQIIRGPSEIELRRENSDWRIQRPLQAPADSAKVEKMLGRLLGARVIEFLSDSDQSVLTPDMDLDAQPEIRFWAEGEDSPHTLRLLGPGPDREGFATVIADYPKRKARIYLAKEPASLANLLADDLRDRTPLHVNLDFVDRIRRQQGAITETLSRAQESDWANDAGQLQTDRAKKVTDAVNGLQLANFTPFINSATPPAVAAFIQINFDAFLSENTPETTAGSHPVSQIWIGKTKEGKILSRVNDSTEFFELSPESWDALVKSTSQSPSTEANPTPPTAP